MHIWVLKAQHRVGNLHYVHIKCIVTTTVIHFKYHEKNNEKEVLWMPLEVLDTYNAGCDQIQA